MKRSESILSQLAAKRYHLTLNLYPAVRENIERKIVELDQELARQLEREAEPGYKDPEWRMPEWGTRGT